VGFALLAPGHQTGWREQVFSARSLEMLRDCDKVFLQARLDQARWERKIPLTMPAEKAPKAGA
jgi:hypothetical protein